MIDISPYYSKLSQIDEALCKTQKEHATKGNEALTIFGEATQNFVKLCETPRQVTTKIKDTYKNTVCALSKIFTIHIFGGWIIKAPEKEVKNSYSEFICKMDGTLIDLSKARKCAKSHEKLGKFIADLSVHLRILKIQLNAQLTNYRSNTLHSLAAEEINDTVISIVNSVQEVRGEYAYLAAKVTQIHAANSIYSGDQSLLNQAFYSILSEGAKTYAIDKKTHQVIETINAKSLLSKIKASTHTNELTAILPLARRMAERLLRQNKVVLGWSYLEFYFSKVDGYLHSKRSEYVLSQIAHDKKLALQLLTSLTKGLIQSIPEIGRDFSIDMSLMQIIIAIKKLPKENAVRELTDETFGHLKQIIEARQTTHWKMLKNLMDDYLLPVNPKATRMVQPFVHFTLPQVQVINFHQLQLLLKQSGCKIKFVRENNTLKTQNLYETTSAEIEAFCKIYFDIVTQKMAHMDQVTTAMENLQVEEIEKKATMSGREYLKQLGPSKEVEKRPQAPEIQEVTIAPTKVENIFGNEFIGKKITRLRMKDLVSNFYVCLEPSDKDSCEAHERKKIEALFADPHQAGKTAQQGFKLSRNAKQKIVLTAKLMGKSGHLRLYPERKVHGINNPGVLWVFRTAVVKGSVQETHQKHLNLDLD